MLRFLLMLVSCCAASQAFAQVQNADRIIAIVGRNRIILQSEVEQQMAQVRMQDSTSDGDSLRCEITRQMILQKMLVEYAERDSLLVSDEEVEGALDNRIRQYTMMYGSKERLEQAAGKTVYQIKEENRDYTRESMMAERAQAQILQNVRITPSEVKQFFDRIPTDSLPNFPATLEIGQIVIEPAVSPELDQYAKNKADTIRKQIVTDGANFEVMAGIHSEDPGSRDNGGSLGTISREGLVPEFAAAAFRLQNGEISPVVKTKFGYHIIQMVQRKGDEAEIRHILIRPERTSIDFNKALAKLDSIRAQLITGKINFQEAVGKYATDEMSKRTGGMITDPQTGSSRLQAGQLDPSLVLMIDSLGEGSYSQPHVFVTQTGERACRIVFMKTRIAPHTANLTDDYAQIQEVALQQKKSQKMQQWIISKSPTYYMKIDPAYSGCSNMQMWQGSMSKN